MTSAYIEAIFVGKPTDADCFKTGKGAEFATTKEARAVFKRMREFAVPIKTARFLVDLHRKDGDIVDTIGLDSKGFERCFGVRARSRSHYERQDRAYWRRLAEARRK